MASKDNVKSGGDFLNKLIRLIRANPVLYDSNHPDYRRTSLRREIWRALGKQLSVTPRFVRVKWQNIRYRYLRDIKKLKTSNTGRKALHTEDLSFLKIASLTRYKRNTSTNILRRFPNSETSSSSRAHSCETANIDRINVTSNDRDDEVSMQDTVGYPAPVDSNSDNLPDISEEPIESDCYKDPTICLAPISSSSYTSADIFEDPSPSGHLVDTNAPQIIKIESVSSQPSSTAFNGMVQLNTSLCSLLEPVGCRESVSDKSDRSVEYVESEIVKKGSHEVQKKSTSHTKKPPSKSMQSNSNDSIELYCLSLVDSFRAMSRLERERVKCEFARILKDAKYTDDE